MQGLIQKTTDEKSGNPKKCKGQTSDEKRGNPKNARCLFKSPPMKKEATPANAKGLIKKTSDEKEAAQPSVKGFIKRPSVEGKETTKRKRTSTKMNAEISFANLTVKCKGDAFGSNDT
jgi:hypothetical protein